MLVALLFRDERIEVPGLWSAAGNAYRRISHPTRIMLV
jgi:hypothetical protein